MISLRTRQEEFACRFEQLDSTSVSIHDATAAAVSGSQPNNSLLANQPQQGKHGREP
jgi:hypothetical protein